MKLKDEIFKCNILGVDFTGVFDNSLYSGVKMTESVHFHCECEFYAIKKGEFIIEGDDHLKNQTVKSGDLTSTVRLLYLSKIRPPSSLETLIESGSKVLSARFVATLKVPFLPSQSSNTASVILSIGFQQQEPCCTCGYLEFYLI